MGAEGGWVALRHGRGADVTGFLDLLGEVGVSLRTRDHDSVAAWMRSEEAEDLRQRGYILGEWSSPDDAYTSLKDLPAILEDAYHVGVLPETHPSMGLDHNSTFQDLILEVQTSATPLKSFGDHPLGSLLRALCLKHGCYRVESVGEIDASEASDRSIFLWGDAVRSYLPLIEAQVLSGETWT